MQVIKPITPLILLFFSNVIFSQSEFPAFGSFSAEEISMKECSFDPEANAVVLLDMGIANYDDEQHLVIETRMRMKILNEKGLEYANIVLPYYHKNDIEYINKIEAYTYNFDASGRPSMIAVDKRSIHTERTSDFYSQIKFAMPAVKAGSIIEYHYVRIRKHYGYLDQWLFQSDRPTLKSSFLLHMLPKHEFTYTVQKSPLYNITIQPMPAEGKIFFEMKNIAGLRIEPFMDAPDDYIQKVIFQHSAYLSSYGTRQNVNTTWKDLALDLMSEKFFGSQLDKDLKIEAVKTIVSKGSTATEKMRSIYEYVQKNISWTGVESKVAPDGLKAVADRKKGSSGEMNLLLVNLLNVAGIESYPLLAAERDYGRVDTTFPFIDRFNKTVALVSADGKQYILDASQSNCPPGLTPYPLLGTVAFIVDKKKFSLIRIAPGNKFYKNIISINGKIDPQGILTANAKIQSYDYARQLRLNASNRDRRKFIAERFEAPYEGLTIDSIRILPPEYDSLPFDQQVNFKQQINESGGYILFNPNLFTGFEKNPFVSSIRFTNVNFGFPYTIVVEETFQLPPGAKVELPGDKTIRSDDKNIEAFKQVRFENGELKILIRFMQSNTLVKPENYPGLKDLYKKMVDALNEPVLIKMPD